MNNITIGEFAKLCGVGIETIRYYQRKGLLHIPVLNNEFGVRKVRRYGVNDISRLNFILLAKNAGFTLKEIKELLEFDAKNDRARVRDMAERRIEKLKLKINELTEACNTLSLLVEKCRDTRSLPCPILMTFNEKNDK